MKIKVTSEIRCPELAVSLLPRPATTLRSYEASVRRIIHMKAMNHEFSYHMGHH
jgi:hypothetical protein